MRSGSPDRLGRQRGIMTALSQNSLALVALTNRLQPSDVSPLKASEAWKLLERVPELSALLGADTQTVGQVTGLPATEAGRVCRLLDTGIGLALKLDSLLETGIVPITALDHEYPQRLRDRLGDAAPPVLYCAGDPALLEKDGIGVVGSRDVGPEAVEATRSVAHVVASAGLTLISGGAKGVDRISMGAATEAGGRTVGVLADSLEQTIARSDNRQALIDGVACLCTPYSPAARFTAGNAMGRNKIIYGLSRVTVVIASSHGEGGTWAGATEAIRKRYGRVAVWIGPGSGPGNPALVKTGGAPLDTAAAVLDLEELDQGTSGPSQIALTWNNKTSSDDSTDEPDVVSEDEPPSTVQAANDEDSPVQPPAGALSPKPNGVCWCGCGKPVEGDSFFVSRHAPGAAQRAVSKHFGSVEAFLLMFGEAPDSGSGG